MAQRLERLNDSSRSRPDYRADLGCWRSVMSHASNRSNRPSVIADCAEPRRVRPTRSCATPISKQRNKHIQQVLVEAAKLAPRQSPELALIHEKEMQRGNRNRATLAVARKMVAWMVAVERRKQVFVPAEKFGGKVAA